MFGIFKQKPPAPIVDWSEFDERPEDTPGIAQPSDVDYLVVACGELALAHGRQPTPEQAEEIKKAEKAAETLTAMRLKTLEESWEDANARHRAQAQRDQEYRAEQRVEKRHQEMLEAIDRSNVRKK